MKRYGLLILTSLMTFTACGESTPIKAELETVKDIKIHSEMVSNFFQSENYDYSNLPAEVDARTNLGDNLPIHITWKSSVDNQKWNIVFKENNNTVTYSVRGNEFDFFNYKLNTEYKIHLELDNYISEPISFTTPSGYVRTLKVEGVSNFRDLGGYGNIKQGLLYRSMTFENNTIQGSEYKDITANGISELRRLGIKSEIDLRREDERGDKYGTIEGINYQFKPLHYGGSAIIDYTGTYRDVYYDNPAKIKEILDFMAVADNYPMDFHCTRGADRTGCIAYIIRGLLGEDEDYILKDYIFTDFYNIGGPIRLENNKYASKFKAEEGETLQEKIYNYLNTKLGVSKDNLNSIINILKVN